MRRFFFGILIVLLAIDNVVAIDLPPLRESRSEVYEYYQLEFLEDGMPGKRTEGGVLAHPMYATYVIVDYLSQWRETGDPVFLEGARTVADAALARMDDFKGSLVYWYTPEMGLTGLPGTFYSGLSQGRYLSVLHQMYEATKDQKYSDAAERVLASLAIPVSEGGVARELAGGIVLEEWPHSVMGIYTLNGWATSMLLVGEYAEKTGSEQARELFDKNVIALDHLIADFDLEDIANTRYALAGYVYVRVVFPGAEGTVEGATVHIPGEGDFQVTDEFDRTRWTNYFLDERSGRVVRANIVLNHISEPDPAVLTVDLAAESDRTALVQISRGEYVPTQTRQEHVEWVTIAEITAGPETGPVDVPIAWENAHYVGYPTAFTKEIGGELYNTYHFLHVDQVARIAELSGNDKLARYAEKWRHYPERWPSMPIYRDAPILLEKY